MEPISILNWQSWRSRGFTWLPAAAVVPMAKPPIWPLGRDGAAKVLLESGSEGRYSYFCDQPERIVIGFASGGEIWNQDGTAQLEFRTGKPLEILRSVLNDTRRPELPNWPPMFGGLIGVVGYDVVKTWERLETKSARDLGLPLYAFIEPHELFVYDHSERVLGIITWTQVRSDSSALGPCFSDAENALSRAMERLGLAASNQQLNADSGMSVHRASSFSKSSFSADEFKVAVGRVQQYIAAGDTYQVNLSIRTSQPSIVPAARVYTALRSINPSPYMGFLQMPAFALVCGSPELLVRLVNGVITSRPIAGTRRRGSAAEQDSRLSTELLANEKERAEHLMLVDLIRNDIGRVSAFGSVEVTEFMGIERYSHVMHIVSQVQGRIDEGRNWQDVFRSMFPGGTITGCPKIRTMEIIEELEPVGRGFYTGALGWISYAGEMEMNIVIRSMLMQGGNAHVQAGAGIVADSDPEHELDEALRKARALWVALDLAMTSHE